MRELKFILKEFWDDGRIRFMLYGSKAKYDYDIEFAIDIAIVVKVCFRDRASKIS